MNYSLTQLKYLVAVDTYRNFAQAAEKCLVTQPTLSMQLRKMEEAFGISFFDRGKQPIVPTESGKRMVEQARNILRECAKLEEMASHDLKAYSGKVQMGVIPTIAPYLLPIFLGDLLANSNIFFLTSEAFNSGHLFQIRAAKAEINGTA